MLQDSRDEFARVLRLRSPAEGVANAVPLQREAARHRRREGGEGARRRHGLAGGAPDVSGVGAGAPPLAGLLQELQGGVPPSQLPSPRHLQDHRLRELQHLLHIKQVIRNNGAMEILDFNFCIVQSEASLLCLS